MSAVNSNIIGIGCIKSADTNNNADYWYRLFKWADTINFFCSGPLNQSISIIVVYLWYRRVKWAATKYFIIILLLFCNLY
jgi:hypothetical protein